MRFEDDYDEENNGLPIIYMALGVSVFIFAVLMLVVSLNKDNTQSSDNKYNSTASVYVTEAVEPVITSSKLVASDLDFWDMYPEEEDEEIIEVTPSATPKITPTAVVTPDLDDGNHVKVTSKDGSEEWIKISDKIEKNNYDFTNIVNSGGQLKYVYNGKNISFSGIDVSRYQKEIDYSRLKAQGIDFVMIRVGARGYKNGTLSMDEYFEDNINKALEAGVDVGLYFYSQAINTQEAEEEADLVINAIAGRTIKYPIAIDMEYVDNDSSRIDTLTKDEKTVITAAFVNKIKAAGYRPMIYGDKEWLLKRIDVSQFNESSIWLSQTDEQPDYPYNFDIWQYSTDGDLYGIEGPVDMNICLVDYAAQ